MTKLPEELIALIMGGGATHDNWAGADTLAAQMAIETDNLSHQMEKHMMAAFLLSTMMLKPDVTLATMIETSDNMWELSKAEVCLNLLNLARQQEPEGLPEDMRGKPALRTLVGGVIASLGVLPVLPKIEELKAVCDAHTALAKANYETAKAQAESEGSAKH